MARFPLADGAAIERMVPAEVMVLGIEVWVVTTVLEATEGLLELGSKPDLIKSFPQLRFLKESDGSDTKTLFRTLQRCLVAPGTRRSHSGA